jgi:hypothetical protein
MSPPANGNGTARWQLWVSVATASFFVIGSLIGLFVQIANLSYAAADLKAKQDAIEHRLEMAEASTVNNRIQITTLVEHQTEIETQMRSVEAMRNLSHANDLRTQAILWEKAFNGRSHYPTDNAYYPSIAAPPR